MKEEMAKSVSKFKDLEDTFQAERDSLKRDKEELERS